MTRNRNKNNCGLTKHDVGIHCLGLLRFELHLTCSATLFLSFEVRACYDSAVDFTGKKVVSVVVIFKIEVARDFYVTKKRISTSRGVCRLLGCSRRAPSAALRLPTVAWRRELRGFTCRSNSVSFLFTQTFPEKVLVVSNHALLKKQSLSDARLHVGSSIDRWIRKC